MRRPCLTRGFRAPPGGEVREAPRNQQRRHETAQVATVSECKGGEGGGKAIESVGSGNGGVVETRGVGGVWEGWGVEVLTSRRVLMSPGQGLRIGGIGGEAAHCFPDGDSGCAKDVCLEDKGRGGRWRGW